MSAFVKMLGYVPVISAYVPVHPSLGWRRSSHCQNSECIEVATQDGMILLRNSKAPHNGVQRYSVEEWQSFVHAIRDGEFDDLCKT